MIAARRSLIPLILATVVLGPAGGRQVARAQLGGMVVERAEPPRDEDFEDEDEPKAEPEPQVHMMVVNDETIDQWVFQNQGQNSGPAGARKRFEGLLKLRV